MPQKFKDNSLEKAEIVTHGSKTVNFLNIFFCNIVKTLNIKQNKNMNCDAIDGKDQILRAMTKSKKTKYIKVYIYYILYDANKKNKKH